MTTAQYRKRPRVEGEEGINEAVQLGLVATGEDAIHCPLLATVAVLAPSSAGSSLELESKFEYSPAVTGIRASLVQSAHAREQLRSLGELQVKQAREQRNAVQQQLQQFEREVSMLNTAAAPKRIDEELPRPGLGWVEPGVTEARAVERPKASTKQTTAATTTTTAAASNDELHLEDLLSPEWLDAIGPVLRAQPNVEQYIGVHRPWTIPARENTFRALASFPPAQTRVVVLGQDPYPRLESAIGIAFCDGAVTSWHDALVPSLRNIIKSALMCGNHATATTAVGELRTSIQKLKLLNPPLWFESTMQQGVMWLNTALTFTSKDQAELARHVAFWNPVITEIFRTILEAKAATKTSNKAGVVFLMWGAYAKSFKKLISKLAAPLSQDLTVEFVEGPHPAVEAFVQQAVPSFTLVNEALARLGEPPVDWLPRRA